MKNVTVTMEEDVARWARIEAARRGISLSRMLGEILREHMELEEAYRQRRADFDSVEARQLRAEGSSLPAREGLHDRSGLR